MKANEQASRCGWGRSLSPFGEEVDGASNVLAQLRLSRSQLETLETQGFVHEERRANDNSCFKLRFRFEGKQVVRYLGTDALRAEAVRNALARHQLVHRTLQRLRRDTHQANRMAREAKKNLLSLVEELGYKFHGFDLRAQRGAGLRDQEVTLGVAATRDVAVDADLNGKENVEDVRIYNTKDCERKIADRIGEGREAEGRTVDRTERPEIRAYRGCQAAVDSTPRIPFGLPCTSKCGGGDAWDDDWLPDESSVSTQRFNRRSARRGIGQQKYERVADLGNHSVNTRKPPRGKADTLEGAFVERAKSTEAADGRTRIGPDRCVSGECIRFCVFATHQPTETEAVRCRGPPIWLCWLDGTISTVRT
jgi:hypothetical protein